MPQGRKSRSKTITALISAQAVGNMLSPALTVLPYYEKIGGFCVLFTENNKVIKSKDFFF